MRRRRFEFLKYNNNWIKDPKTEPEIFINEFMIHACGGTDCPEDIVYAIYTHYRDGYCWHFAHMLKDVFKRGTICWAAPDIHIVWIDTDGTAYDAGGKVTYERPCYYIPEKYLGKFSKSFKHISPKYDKEYQALRTTLIKIMKRYCFLNHIKYDQSVENYI